MQRRLSESASGLRNSPFVASRHANAQTSTPHIEEKGHLQRDCFVEYIEVYL